MSTCATIALISMVVGEYSGVLFPALAAHQKLVALTVTLFFALLHWRGVLWGSYTQNVTSLIKVLAFTAFGIIAFTHQPAVTSQSVTQTTVPHGFAVLAAIVLALQGVLYTYDGWYGVCYFGGEV